MIVVHTNVMARLEVGGEGGADAAWLFLRDAEWAAPPLLLGELRSVLLGFVRRGSATAAFTVDGGCLVRCIHVGRHGHAGAHHDRGNRGCACESNGSLRTLGQRSLLHLQIV